MSRSLPVHQDKHIHRIDTISRHIAPAHQPEPIPVEPLQLSPAMTSTHTPLSWFTLSSHVLDTTAGTPAAGMHLLLERRYSTGISSDNDDDREEQFTYETVARGVTDNDGRVTGSAWVWTNVDGSNTDRGRDAVYRLTFRTGRYYRERNTETLYPIVQVVFEPRKGSDKAARNHYHIPLLISPFGYSTYRGS